MIIFRPFKISLDNNIEVADGNTLAQSMVVQVLMTKAKSPVNLGEYHPDPKFGSLLYTLQGTTDPDDVIKSQAHGYISDAFKKWLPGFQFLMEYEKLEADIYVRVFWSYLRFQGEVSYDITKGTGSGY